MTIQPYLFFEGRAEEALAFYQKVFGAEPQMLMRYKDSPIPKEQIPPGSEDKVLHMAVKIGDSIVLGSDGHCSGKPEFQGFSLTYTAKDEADAVRVFAALSDGGTVRMPPGKTFFSPWFGIAADRFGIGWMVIVQP